MMKHFVFSILVMAILAAHQEAIAVDSGCLVQGSPAMENGDSFLVRDMNNVLRKWQRNKKEDNTERWDVIDMNIVTNEPQQIRSDPSVYRELSGPIVHIFARGERGHLLEWRWQYEPSPRWQFFDLTLKAAGGRTIAGVPSRLSNGMSDYSLYDSETVGTFFTNPKTDYHLLML
jgi:hypothetical protein